MRLFSALLLIGAAAVQAQTFNLAPAFAPQFFSNGGIPLAGGFVYTCSAGAACPGTPATTYSDSGGFNSNTNPVVLDAFGRASIWLNCSIQYKFVLADSTNVTIKTTDNVSCSTGGGGGPTTNYWTLSGSDITNNNGSGTGNVNVGAGLNVGGNIQLTGTLKLRDTQSSANFAILRAASLMSADVTWRWPATDAIGCLTSDGSGNLSFVSCAGGGGGGSPGGNNNDVQFKNATAFGGSDNFTWNNTAQLLTITAASPTTQGIVVLTGFVQADNGFDAVNNAAPTTPLNFNVIQAPTGGMAANSFTATKYMEIGSSAGTPAATNSEPGYPHAGAMYCDTTSSPCVAKLFNGSAWVSLATGGATPPGGSNNQIQINSSGSFAGSPNLTFASQQLTVVASSSSSIGLFVGTGFAQSDAGFVATPATATRFNVIQAPGGGVAALSGTFSNYIQAGHSNGVPPLTSTDTFASGAMYCDTGTSPCVMKFFNGTAWATLSGGGGSTPPGGPDASVQFSSGGTFAGSSNFVWSNPSHDLIISTLANSQGLVIIGGYAQADVGFLAAVNSSPSTPLQFNAIQSPTGGVYARSLKAINYVQAGNSFGAPTPTSGDAFVAGALYWDTGAGALKVHNGSTFLTVSTGSGIGSLNGLTGALTLQCSASTSCTIGASGTTITITAPQALATASTPTFSGVVASGGPFNSTATGSTSAFQTSTGTVIITGGGTIGGQILNVNTANLASTVSNSLASVGGASLCSSGSCSGGSALSIAGSTVVNSSGQWVGGAVLATAGQNIQTGNVFAVSGGFFGISGTLNAGSCQIFVRGGIIYATAGSC